MSVFRFLILIGLWKGILNDDLETFAMNRNCGGTLKMEYEDIYSAAVSFTSADKCDYTIQAYSSQDSLMFYFESFDVDCEDGHLEIVYSTDPNFLASKSINGLTGAVCSNKSSEVKSSEVYVAPASFLRLTFQPASGSLVGRVSFKVILTTFRNFPCDAYGYRYHCYNGRCISKKLSCNNGYNHCGDNSHCSWPVDRTGEIIGTILGIILFLSCAVCICGKRNNNRQSSCCHVRKCAERICECCSEGCSSVGDCCACAAEYTVEMARGICHTSARGKCCVVYVQTPVPTESPEEDPALPQTVSAEIQTDAAIQTDRADDTEEWTNTASAPPLEADHTGQPPSYEVAIAVDPPSISAVTPPSYDIAMKLVKL